MPTFISLIAAMDKNRVIGKNNELPWHLPIDLQHFKTLTRHKTVIMGRKTYEAIGKPLPQRTNIVITRQEKYTAPGCIVVHSLPEALAAAGTAEEIMIIGGAEIYAQALPIAHRLYLTFIETEVAGDAYFPAWNATEWKEVSRREHLADEKNIFKCTFVTFAKRANMALQKP